MYVRNLKLNVITAIDKKFDKILNKNTAYEKKILNKINFILIVIYKAYKFMLGDLKSRNGLIYPKKIKT